MKKVVLGLMMLLFAFLGFNQELRAEYPVGEGMKNVYFGSKWKENKETCMYYFCIAYICKPAPLTNCGIYNEIFEDCTLFELIPDCNSGCVTESGYVEICDWN